MTSGWSSPTGTGWSTRTSRLWLERFQQSLDDLYTVWISLHVLVRDMVTEFRELYYGQGRCVLPEPLRQASLSSQASGVSRRSR